MGGRSVVRPSRSNAHARTIGALHIASLPRGLASPILNEVQAAAHPCGLRSGMPTRCRAPVSRPFLTIRSQLLVSAPASYTSVVLDRHGSISRHGLGDVTPPMPGCDVSRTVV